MFSSSFKIPSGMPTLPGGAIVFTTLWWRKSQYRVVSQRVSNPADPEGAPRHWSAEHWCRHVLAARTRFTGSGVRLDGLRYLGMERGGRFVPSSFQAAHGGAKMLCLQQFAGWFRGVLDLQKKLIAAGGAVDSGAVLAGRSWGSVAAAEFVVPGERRLRRFGSGLDCDIGFRDISR